MLDLFACFSFIVQFFALFCLFLFFFCFIKVVLYVFMCFLVFLFYLLAVLGFILLSFFFFLVNDDIMPITYTYEYIRVCERVCVCVFVLLLCSETLLIFHE